MDLSKFRIIGEANEIGQVIWEVVDSWAFFEKDTLGKQIVRSADSISANLSEAFGRYGFADRKRFAYYARGSLCETINWVTKASDRSLIESNKATELLEQLSILSHKLNVYIKKLK